MLFGGVPEDLPQNLSLAFLRRVARKQALRGLEMLSERVGIADFDVSETTSMDQLRQRQKEEKARKKGILLPRKQRNESFGIVENQQKLRPKDKGFLGL
jgi:hypothetical protein